MSDAIDRVYSVATTVSYPTSVADIAAEANVAESTARTHLNQLEEMNVLLKCDEESPTTYEPDPLYIRMQTLRDLLDNHDYDDLRELKVDLEAQIESWRSEYNVQSPELLREGMSDSINSAGTRGNRQVANDWEIVRYRLEIIKEAIYLCNNRPSV